MFYFFQLEAFEMVFSKSQYPDVAVLERLSDGMNLGIEKVCVSLFHCYFRYSYIYRYTTHPEGIVLSGL